jgi:hypothetical protein
LTDSSDDDFFCDKPGASSPRYYDYGALDDTALENLAEEEGNDEADATNALIKTYKRPDDYPDDDKIHPVTLALLALRPGLRRLLLHAQLAVNLVKNILEWHNGRNNDNTGAAPALFADLEHLHATICPFSVRELTALLRASQLKRLHLGLLNIMGEGHGTPTLPALAQLPHLRRLSLDCCHWQPNGRVMARELRSLAALRQLRALRFRWVRGLWLSFGDAHLARLLAALPQLRELVLRAQSRLSSRALRPAGECCAHLRKLELWVKFDVAVVADARQPLFPRMRELSVGETEWPKG